jgi:hypothetical protein
MSSQDKCLASATLSTAAIAVANIGLCGMILLGPKPGWFVRYGIPGMMVMAVLVIIVSLRTLRLVWIHRNNP